MKYFEYSDIGLKDDKRYDNCIGFIYQYDRKDAVQAKAAYAEAVKLRPNLQAEVNGHIGRMSDL